MTIVIRLSLAMSLVAAVTQFANAAPILGVSATASTFHSGSHDPELAVNGAGLDSTTGLHEREGVVRWTSAQFNGGSSISDLVGAWLIADLGGEYELNHVDVWNYGSSPTSRGYQATDVFVSNLASPGTDFTNLSDWTQVYGNEPLAQATNAATPYSATDVLDLTGHTARHVAFVVASTFADTDGWVGLSELQFDGTSTQPSGTWLLDTSGNWNNPLNWAGSMVPNGGEQNVIFGDAITSARTVFTETDVTANSIAFDNANEYVVAGNGTVTLDGNATTATVSVAQGSHQFQAAVELNVTTDVDLAAGTGLAFNNVLTLNGNTLNKSGDGTLSVNNIQSIGAGGAIAFAAGMVGGSGTIDGNLNNNGGMVAPGGTPGSLRVAGDYVQSAGSLLIEIDGVQNGEYDVLEVDGTATLDGMLDIALLSYTPSLGDSFTVLSAASILDNGLALTSTASEIFDMNITATAVELLVTNVDAGVKGDFNNDGIVNSADYTVWRDNVGADEDTDVLNGNGNGGTVDTTDYELWKSNFGTTVGASAESTVHQSIPEPTAWTTFALACIALVGVRRHCP